MQQRLSVKLFYTIVKIFYTTPICRTYDIFDYQCIAFLARLMRHYKAKTN